MDASYVYWFTRIGALETVFTLILIPALFYLIAGGVIKLITYVEGDDMPDVLKKIITTKRIILAAFLFVTVLLLNELVPSKQDLRMMLAVDLATNHGIKVLVEK